MCCHDRQPRFAKQARLGPPLTRRSRSCSASFRSNGSGGSSPAGQRRKGSHAPHTSSGASGQYGQKAGGRPRASHVASSKTAAAMFSAERRPTGVTCLLSWRLPQSLLHSGTQLRWRHGRRSARRCRLPPSRPPCPGARGASPRSPRRQ